MLTGLEVVTYAALMPKPQPNQLTYGTSELNLFTLHTRESYAKAFGKQAPDYDNNQPEKRWIDDRPETAERESWEQIVYFRLVEGSEVGGGQPQFKRFPMSFAKSQAVNIPPTLGVDSNVPRPNVPAEFTPVRQLLPNEKFSLEPAGGLTMWMIRRTDIEPSPDTPAVGGFTEGDRKMLKEIHAALVGNKSTAVSQKSGKPIDIAGITDTPRGRKR